MVYMYSLLKKIWRVPARVASLARSIVQLWRRGGVVNASICVLDVNGLLVGKRVLITGGSLGIGFAIANTFIRSGASVLVTGRNESDLKAASDRISSSNFHWMNWDITDFASTEEKLGQAEIILGGCIDILVNNAGILINESFPCVSEDGWDRVYAVNSKGLFFMTQSMSKRWLENPSSDVIRKIINISSTSGFTPGAYPYRMTKWDVVGMTQGLALNLAPHNIIVNGIAPGRTAGRMLGIDSDNIFDPEIPAGRAALPEEIAELALFLASDSSNYIMGQTIICDGGMTLMPKI